MPLSFVNEAPAPPLPRPDLPDDVAPARRRAAAGRQRRAEPVTNRVRRDGKFFRLGAEKFYVKGVTYGPFAPEQRRRSASPSARAGARTSSRSLELGANCVRIYHIPPQWFLDLAQEMGLKIFLDVCWPKNLTFCRRPGGRRAGAAPRCASRARRCGNHPAVFAISVVNEIPPDIVRFCGARAVEQFIDELVAIAKAEAPNASSRSPTSRRPNTSSRATIDFVCFNVYLHDEQVFRNYLGAPPEHRRRTAADARRVRHRHDAASTPRSSRRRSSRSTCARCSTRGCVGTFIFSYTDDWYAHGWQIEDWAFGLIAGATRRLRPSRRSTRSSELFQQRAAGDGREAAEGAASSSARTTARARSNRACGRWSGSATRDYEVIFVDDGSTDNTQEILQEVPLGAEHPPEEHGPELRPQRRHERRARARSSSTPTATARRMRTGFITSRWRWSAATTSAWAGRT